MKIFSRTLALFAALCGLAANAVPLNINVDNAGVLLNGAGIANSTQYGQGNNNPDSNLAFLKTEIGYWNNAFNPNLPDAVGPVAAQYDSLNDVSSYLSVAGYDYVVFHFGAGNAGGGKNGPKGGWWQAFYLGGVGGETFSLPQVGQQNVGGFSSARYFNGAASVPDEGMTFALLLLGCSAVALASRKSKRA